MDASTKPASDLRHHVPLWLLALVMLSTSVGMHILVPALPDIAADLGSSRASTLLAVTFYILGMAVGQLVYGPIADYLGRRPTILAALVLFILTSIAAAFAPNIGSLLVLRFIQALGGCAGLVLGRAIVRDIAGPKDAAQKLAMLNTMVIIGPAVAPIIGGFTVSFWDWRGIMWLLAVLGTIMIVLLWFKLPETGSRGANTSLGRLWRNYRSVITSPVFLALSVGGGCATMSLYGFVAVAPFIFADLGRSAHETGFFLSVVVLGTWVATFIFRRLSKRFSLERLMVGGNFISLLAGIGMLTAVLTGILSVFIAVTVIFVFTLGMGIASPGSLSKAMSTNPAVIGSASGLYGFTQMGIGALCTVLAGIPENPALGAAIVMTGAGIVAQACFWYALRKS